MLEENQMQDLIKSLNPKTFFKKESIIYVFKQKTNNFLSYFQKSRVFRSFLYCERRDFKKKPFDLY
jgi:hypothetical protein